MRKYNIITKTALVASAVALSACSSDNDIVDNNPINPETSVSEKTMTFHASMDNESATRTTFTDNQNKTTNTVWAANDQISILNTATVVDEEGEEDSPAEKGVFTIGGPANGTAYTKEENFTGGKIKANGNGSDAFYAFYPADNDNFTNTNGTVTMTGNVLNVQYATNGTYDQKLHFMSAYSTSSTFEFKNVCTLLKITLSNNTSISKIKVVANPSLSSAEPQTFSYTSITGQFDATINSSGDNTGTASITPKEANKTSVELLPTDNTTIGNGTFYMVVLPAAIPNGFTLLLEKTDGTIYQRINKSITSFGRNQMINLGSYNCSSSTTLEQNGMTTLSDVVDLGLPSGTIWATKNIKGYKSSTDGTYPGTQYFTQNIDDYGQYYAWAEDFGYGENSNDNPNSTETTKWRNTTMTNKTTYTWATYKWCNGDAPGIVVNNIIKYQSGSLDIYDDIAYIKSNKKYCMPIYAQFVELLNSNFCSYTSSLEQYNNTGQKCIKITSKRYTSRSLWLPAAGSRYYELGNGNIHNTGSNAQYWSRTLYNRRYAYCFDYPTMVNGNSSTRVMMNAILVEQFVQLQQMTKLHL